jgi:drug/metabolite transporter (DMT)-like permease
MDVTKTMLIALLTPLFAVLLGMAVLGERLTWRTLAGGALILSGIGSVVWPRLRGGKATEEKEVKEGREEEARVPS